MNSNHKILATLQIFNSKRDIHGNVYWAFTYTDNLTGKSVSALGYAGSNLRAIPDAIGLSENVMVIETELKIREFNKFVKNFKFAGCTSSEVAKFIKGNLK